MGSHGTSPHKGVRNLSSSLAWKFFPPEGKFSSASNGALLLDDVGNVYAGFSSGIFKFTPEGKLLWRYQVAYNDIPALMDGLLYTTSTQGFVDAVSMETGRLVWRSAPVCTWPAKMNSKAHYSCNCAGIGGDIGAVAAHKGTIVVKTHVPEGGGACKVAGLNATDGAFLWDFATDHLVWNFYPMLNEFDDGDTFVFQDSTGGVYRLGLADGREVWKVTNHEGWYESWTDGGLQIGPNKVVYAVKTLKGHNQGPGVVRAYRIEDGKFLWESPPMGEPPNAWPIIARMREGDPLTVIQAFGMAGGFNPIAIVGSYIPQWLWQSPLSGLAFVFLRSLMQFQMWIGDYSTTVFGHPELRPGVWGFDAETGKLLWKYNDMPVWKRAYFKSEQERLLTTGGMCIPNPCGNPTMDADGRVYIGMLDGIFYHFERDPKGTGVKTVSTYDTEAAFSNGGTTIAPGFVGVVNCDTLYVFKE